MQCPFYNNTIISGEYITIYQYQRKQQKLNLAEKERQLQTLSRDRTELKAKLNELQSLLKTFLVYDKVFLTRPKSAKDKDVKIVYCNVADVKRQNACISRIYF